ncbi:dicarboxylate/amino acid:cation symporter [Magnetococcus sp. PR-3]|uniref:dicarboxylate/amino acid:cation symporter n=1 Tax=Magnetococcus sp. PR-3 TaxID=3120355 RepID=UPI002FCDF735
MTNFLTSPWTLMISVFIGVYIGLYEKGAIPYLEPVGLIYINLVTLCVIPILLSSISINLGKLLHSAKGRKILRRLLFLYLVLFVLVAFIGICVGVLGNPGGNLDQSQRSAIGEIIQQSPYMPEASIKLLEDQSVESGRTLVAVLIDKVIPHNLFAAMSGDDVPKVCFFSVLLGLVFGAMSSHKTGLLTQLLSNINEAFVYLMQWLMVPLPIALICLLAGQIGGVSFEAIQVLAKLAISVVVADLLLFAVFLIMLSVRSRQSVFGVLYNMREPILISLAASNSFGAVPSAIEGMKYYLRMGHRSMGGEFL